MSWSVDSFRTKLENEYTFPVVYIFKFIVPLDKKNQLVEILPVGELSFRQSSKNSYVSATLKTKVASSDAVIEVYKKAYKIEGILAL